MGRSDLWAAATAERMRPMSPDQRARSRPDRTNRRRPSVLASDGKSLMRLAAQARSRGGAAGRLPPRSTR
eukprot:10132532-Alexandrium_andersonii.AAC.1